MKFCTSCGAKKDDNSPFCNQCGKKFEDEPVVQTRTVTRSLPTLTNISLKTKLLLGALLFFVVVGFGLYKWGEHVTEIKNVLAAFTEHLEKGNVEKLQSMLETDDQSLSITEEYVKQLIAYLEENPNVKNGVLAKLKQDVTVNHSSMKANTIYDFDDEQLITLEKRGKRFLLFDHYRFVLHTFPLYVTTNYTEDLQLFVDGKKVTPASLDMGTFDLGSHLPRVYKIKAVLATDFVEIEKEIEVSHFSETHSDLYLDIDSIALGTNIEDGSILVNGKDSKLKTTMHDYVELGPVLMDGTMKIQVVKDTPFGKVQSLEVPIDGNTIKANVQLNEEQKSSVQEQLKSFLLTYSKALMYKDEGILKENSDAVSNHIQYRFGNIMSSNLTYAGYLNEAVINGDSIYIEQKDGEWNVYVEVSETWNEDYVSSGDPISLSEESYTHFYTLTFNEKLNKWVIDGWESAWDFDKSLGISLNINADEQKKQFEESPVLKSNKLDVASSHIGPFVQSYISSSVRAMNERDFSLVADYFIPSSSYAKEASDYIKYIESKGITEDLNRVDIVKVEQKEDDIYIVTTFEEYYIYYSNGSKAFKSFDSKYEVKTMPDGLKMNKVIEIKEKGI